MESQFLEGFPHYKEVNIDEKKEQSYLRKVWRTIKKSDYLTLKFSVSAVTTQLSRVTSNQPSLIELKAAVLIHSSMPDFRCSINVYGWGSGGFYLYSKSKPCTNYFLPNLVTSDQMAIDYRKDIEQNPPRVIKYGCLDYLTCSDLDTNEFETNVFPEI